MKFGIENKLTTANTTFTSTVAVDAGKDETNILDPKSQQVYGVTQATVDLTLEFTTPMAMQFIALFNCSIRTQVTIEVYTTFPGVASDTKTVTVGNLVGLDFLNTFMVLEDDTTVVEAIKLVITGGLAGFETSIGYLWAGDMVDLGCLENATPTESSTDDTTVSRTGTPNTKRRYNFQEYKLTTKKEQPYLTHRSNMRQLLDTGTGTPRPWYIDVEPFFSNPEVLYGILDSTDIQYDGIEFNLQSIQGQSTLGIMETT